MTGGFAVRIVTAEDRTVVIPSGELDLLTSPELDAALAPLLGDGPVVVDLRELEFVDSSGLRLLALANRRAGELGSAFGLIRGSGPVDRPFVVAGLVDRFTWVSDDGSAGSS